MARGNLLAYPCFNEEFKMHTDARNFQLGAVIIQKVIPIAFYSIKLTDSQKRYTLTKKELLSTVETLKEFMTVLLVQRFRIYTYHKP